MTNLFMMIMKIPILVMRNHVHPKILYVQMFRLLEIELANFSRKYYGPV